MNGKISSIVLFLLLTIMSFAQSDALKSEAIKEMQAGRYGEAIDLLNRFISARPQEVEGYNLRGLCFEKRAQYEMAVYDFRSARKIKSNDKQILVNLSRATDAWYKLIYNKIEGHKREIALNPKRPVNYLEIGKCYKNLGEWITAEEWYDKYLQMEEASSDEIIRYTEILAKNSHTSKGVPILKRYSEKYPLDHRIWSRYGFFVLWEGKTKLAIDAFEKALALRPYFKEAMDGLDQAKGKGYIYTINDTSYRTNRRGTNAPPEYAIDKYYKLVKKNPSDMNIRYILIDELLKKNRFEEAYDQIVFMKANQEDSTSRFQEINDRITMIRDSVYKQDVNIYTERFQKNNKDKEAASKLSEAYAHLFDYDNSIMVLESYLSNVNEDQDLDLRYMLTKYCAWSYQWNKAFANANILIKEKPDNKDYQLLMAQLISWNVIDAKPEEIEQAKSYLSNILKDDPKNMPAILSLAFLYSGLADFENAMKYIQIARSIDPDSKQLEAVENHYNTRIEVEADRNILKMRGVAGKLADEGNCKGAYDVYKDIMSKLENPEKNVLLEYAAFSSCAGDYSNAVQVYDRVLNDGFDMDVASLRAMNIMLAGDTAKAIKEFLALKEKENYNYSLNYYLGDLYERVKQQDNAIELYESLIDASEKDPTIFDSTQLSTFSLRLEYLNERGSSFSSIFGYIGLAPTSSYYSDNQQFTYSNYGLRADVSLFDGFSVGATFLKHRLNNAGLYRDLTTFKGNLSFRTGYFFTSAGFGKTRTNLSSQTNMLEFNARYEKTDKLLINFNYEKNDARVILFSPNIINLLLKASIFRLNGSYNFPNKFLLSSYFHYVKITDGNAGNDFQLRLGKLVLPELKIGYEYYYSNYSFSPEYFISGKRVVYYYAPKNFESHSLWGDYKVYTDDEIKFSIGGKLGYVPSSDYLLRELYCEASYHPFSTFTLSGKVTAGSSFRDDADYSYVSAFLNAYLSIF